jgi:hypothetical protein
MLTSSKASEARGGLSRLARAGRLTLALAAATLGLLASACGRSSSGQGVTQVATTTISTGSSSWANTFPLAAATGVHSERRLETRVVGDIRYPSGPLTDAATRAPHLADTARAYRSRSRTAAGEAVDIRVSRFYSFP